MVIVMALSCYTLVSGAIKQNTEYNHYLTEARKFADLGVTKYAIENYNKAIGKECKPKSRKQIEKWLKNPYSDSAAYKMWGNGIAACNAWFVLAGIACYAQKTEE